MAHQNLGVVLLRLDRLSEAEQHMREAIRLQPDEAEAHSGLGAALARQARMAEAIDAYREAVRLEAVASLGSRQSRCRAGEFQEHPMTPMASLLQAIAIDTGPAAWRYRVATLLHEQGRTAEAIQQLEAAVRIDPDYTEARDALQQLAGRYEKRVGTTFTIVVKIVPTTFSRPRQRGLKRWTPLPRIRWPLSEGRNPWQQIASFGRRRGSRSRTKTDSSIGAGSAADCRRACSASVRSSGSATPGPS